VIVEGRATLLEPGPDSARAVDLLTAKYPQYRTLGLAGDVATVIAISPERLLSWRYG
jgi:hypothetical protein